MKRKSEDMVTAMVADQLSELLSRGYDKANLGRFFSLNNIASQLYENSKLAFQSRGNTPVMFNVNFVGRVQNSIAIVNLVYKVKPVEQQLSLFSFSASMGNRDRKSLIGRPDDIPSIGSLKKWITSAPELVKARKHDIRKPRK